MPRILLIEDEDSIRHLISYDLKNAGYEVVGCADGASAREKGLSQSFDIMIIDWMLPEISGIELVRLFRGKGIDSVMMMLTARDEEEDILEAFDAGVDDYITKPFEPRELLARIEVQLRPSRMRQEDVLTCGMLTLKPLLRQAFVGKQSVKLTRTETAILKLLMLNPGQVIPKSQMLDQISEDTPDGMENSLKVHISHLRSKLRTISEQEMIESVWGIGFRIHPQS